MEWWVRGRRWERVGDVVLVVGVVTATTGVVLRAAARRPPPPSPEEVEAWQRAARLQQR